MLLLEAEGETPVLPASEKSISLAVGILQQGGLVAYPTDTVYGLGAHALMPRAVERVFEAKGRAPDAPIPLLLYDASELSTVARTVSEAALWVAEHFWPGALTIVLPRSSRVPPLVSAGGDSIAVRVPDHPTVREMVRRLGAPITGTSANLSGHPNPLTAQDVQAQLGGRIDLILDGGRCPGGIPSTVVDLTGLRPRLLREGAISRELLQAVLPDLE